MAGIAVRQATLADARDIARLHVKVSRETYRDLAPPQAQARLDEDHRTGAWKEKLASPAADQIVLLAEIPGRLVGIGAAGAPSETIFGRRGEIKSLYVDPDFKRRGIGLRLLSALAAHLTERGYAGIALGVVEGNHAAMAFYTALKGQPAGTYTDPGPIWRSRNVAFVWDDLSALTAAA